MPTLKWTPVEADPAATSPPAPLLTEPAARGAHRGKKVNGTSEENLRNVLYKEGFFFGRVGAAGRPVNCDDPEFLAYRNAHVARMMDNRLEGPLTPAQCEEILRRKRDGITKKDRAPPRITGKGIKHPICTMDEAAANGNHVSEFTLQCGEAVNKLEGAGKRICMGLAGLYYMDPDAHWSERKLRAKTLHFFQFRADQTGSKSGKQQTPGPATKVLKCALKLVCGNRVPGGMPKDKGAQMKKLIEVIGTRSPATLQAQYGDAFCSPTNDNITWDYLCTELKKAAAAIAARTTARHTDGVDRFDYHGNFTAPRFEAWLDHINRLIFLHIRGEAWRDPGTNGADDPGTTKLTEDEFAYINIDGAKYHVNCINKSPTKNSSRTEMIDWLKQHHPTKITAADEAPATAGSAGGKSREKLFAIIEPLKPAKKFSCYEICNKYGNKCVITPSYCARSAQVEVGWANIKNPISRIQTKNLNELEQQINHAVETRCTEQMWLGSWRTTRQWQDACYAENALSDETPRTAPHTGHFSDGGVVEDDEDGNEEEGMCVDGNVDGSGMELDEDDGGQVADIVV